MFKTNITSFVYFCSTYPNVVYDDISVGSEDGYGDGNDCDNLMIVKMMHGMATWIMST